MDNIEEELLRASQPPKLDKLFGAMYDLAVAHSNKYKNIGKEQFVKIAYESFHETIKDGKKEKEE